jgi:hypothetical protein
MTGTSARGIRTPMRAGKSAARLAAEDPVGNATKIGHDCREAMQFFATSMLAKAGVHSDDPPDKTVSRIRAVVDSRRSGLGEKEAAFLDALLSSWGTVIDLAQRQEHGGQKEGESLNASTADASCFRPR